MPFLPSVLALLAIFSLTDAGLIGTRVARQEEAASFSAGNKGEPLLQIFQDQSISRADIKHRVSSWASDNQFADLVAAFEQSVRQRTLARREQAKEAAVELPRALDTIAEIEDDMLLTPSETYSKVDQTLNAFSPKLRSLVLTAMEPTPLSNSTTDTVQRDDSVLESSGDLPVEVVEESGDAVVEGSGTAVEGSGAADAQLRVFVEGSGIEVERSGDDQILKVRTLPLRSAPIEGSGIEEGSGLEGSGLAGSGIEGSGFDPAFPMLPQRDEQKTTTDVTQSTIESTTVRVDRSSTTATTMQQQLPPIQVIIDVYDDSISTTAAPLFGAAFAPGAAR